MFSDVDESNGLIHLRCSRPVNEMTARVESALKEHGLRVFARVDHSNAAAEAGLTMRPAQVLLFGNPQVGTPAMIAAPTLAIDLPSKALIWEDEDGSVWLTYNAPDYLKKRHGIPEELARSLSKLAGLLNGVVKHQESGAATS